MLEIAVISLAISGMLDLVMLSVMVGLAKSPFVLNQWGGRVSSKEIEVVIGIWKSHMIKLCLCILGTTAIYFLVKG